MRVEIDDKSGFCFGVVRAISLAEEALRQHGVVYSLGDIVHNRVEVQRLEKLGLKTISDLDFFGVGGVSGPQERIRSLAGGEKDFRSSAWGEASDRAVEDREKSIVRVPHTNQKIFIRAHGEPPSTYERARELGIEVIDATCPVVAQLQKKVVEAHRLMSDVGGQVVILGKRGHAEVIGLTGQVDRPTIVIEGEDDLHLIDFSRPIYFLSQTTQSIALFNRLTKLMEQKQRIISKVLDFEPNARSAPKPGFRAFNARVLNAHTVVVRDDYAHTCHPCRWGQRLSLSHPCPSQEGPLDKRGFHLSAVASRGGIQQRSCCQAGAPATDCGRGSAEGEGVPPQYSTSVGGGVQAQFIALDTICRQVSNREEHLCSFARRFDTVIFVSGRKSSNGRVLFDVCRAANPRSFLIEEPSELRSEWFDGACSVGICGATSTPKWLMENVKSAIETNRYE